MTESQLDNMLGLCEMGIERAYEKKPEWITVTAERSRLSSFRRVTLMVVIFQFPRDPKVYSLKADSLSQLLESVTRECAFLKHRDRMATSGRRVLVEKKEAVPA